MKAIIFNLFCIVFLVSCTTNNNDINIRKVVFGNNTDSVYYYYSNYSSISSNKKDVFLNDDFNDNRNNWHYRFPNYYGYDPEFDKTLNPFGEIEGCFYLYDNYAFIRPKIKVDISKSVEFEITNLLFRGNTTSVYQHNGVLLITAKDTISFYTCNQKYNNYGNVCIAKNNTEIFNNETTFSEFTIGNSKYYYTQFSIRRIKPWTFYYFNKQLLFSERDSLSDINEVGLVSKDYSTYGSTNPASIYDTFKIYYLQK